MLVKGGFVFLGGYSCQKKNIKIECSLLVKSQCYNIIQLL